MNDRIFYEGVISRLVAPSLFIGMGCFSLIVPLVRDSRVLTLGVYLIIAISTGTLVKQLAWGKPVLQLRAEEIVIRGVRPGVWKLFQFWRTETIKLSEIVRVRAGYLRSTIPLNLNIPPVGEPSRNSLFQFFLWIDYVRNGRNCEIYYPHFKSVGRYRAALTMLREMVGNERFEERK